MRPWCPSVGVQPQGGPTWWRCPLSSLAAPLQLHARLAGEARACFGELQDWFMRDAARGVPADGTVHPLCATSVSLLKRLLAAPGALPVLFAEGE